MRIDKEKENTYKSEEGIIRIKEKEKKRLLTGKITCKNLFYSRKIDVIINNKNLKIDNFTCYIV